MSEHACLKRCNVCPDLYAAYLQGCAERGEEPGELRSWFVMPWCMGGAVYPDNWKAHCTCYRGSLGNNPIAILEARVADLESQLAEQRSRG